MKFEFWFSRKLSLKGDGSTSSSTGVVIAVAGVALALAIMILSLSVTVGFKKEIEKKLTGFESPISIHPPYNTDKGEYENIIYSNDSLIRIIKYVLPESNPVIALRSHAILKTDSNFMAVECFSYGEGHDNRFESSNIVRGELPEATDTGTDNIAISSKMARLLGIDTLSTAYLYFFVNGAPKARKVTVSGIYDSNFSDYDQTVVYCNYSLLHTLLPQDGLYGSSILIEGTNLTDATNIIQSGQILQNALIDAYRTNDLTKIYPVSNVVEKGASFYSWLDLLDTNVVVIFILMAAVAAFTLISSLFIIILDRIPTIGVLRAIGLAKSSVTRIFVNLVMRIVGIGLIIGNIVAIGIIIIQNVFGIIPLNPQMYYLDKVPFELSVTSILAINLCVILCAWIVLVVPARVASRIDPARTMRYE